MYTEAAQNATPELPVYGGYPDLVNDARRNGAHGDGQADDTAALQRLADRGGIVWLGSGTYRITSELLPTLDNTTIAGFGATLVMDIPASVTLSDRCAVRASGTPHDTMALTADLAKDATVVTVADTSSLAAGDLVLITSDQNYTDGATTGGNRGAMHYVDVVTGPTTFTLTEPSLYAYAAASAATVRKITPLRGFKMIGVNVRGRGLNFSHSGVQVDCAVDPEIVVTVTGCEDTTVQCRRTYGGSVQVNARDAISGPLGTTGYGVSILEGSRDVTVERGRFANCRHSVTGGGTIISTHITVRNNYSVDAIDAHFDVHEEGADWKFTDNTAVGGLIGFGIRGQRTQVYRNKVRNTSSHGIRVRNFDTNTDGLTGCVVADNDVENTGGTGIMWEGTTTCRNINGIIRNNRVVRCVGNNVQVWRSDKLLIAGNELDTTIGSGGGDGNNIRVNGASAADRCTDITVKGGVHRGAENRWFRADFTDKLTVSGVYPETGTLTLGSCTNYDLYDNYGPATSFGDTAVRTSDAVFSLTPFVSAEHTVHNGTLTVDRQVTLVTTNAKTGQRWTITRTGGGAGNLLIGSGLKTLTTGTWCEVMYTGSAYILIRSGTV